jgi:hypothetical protein
MDDLRPNGYLRCESRRPRGGLVLGLWKYSLAFVIVASATLDALWLVPMQQAQDAQARADSAYRDAVRVRCRMHHEHAPAPVIPKTR